MHDVQTFLLPSFTAYSIWIFPKCHKKKRKSYQLLVFYNLEKSLSFWVLMTASGKIYFVRFESPQFTGDTSIHMGTQLVPVTLGGRTPLLFRVSIARCNQHLFLYCSCKTFAGQSVVS